MYWFGRASSERGCTVAPAPLAPDEAYEVDVTRRVVHQFVGRHGGTASEAETQIRSLLEGLLRTGHVEQARDGLWRLQFSSGYLLLLSPDRQAVIGYHTTHRERTWSQVKCGVVSRSPRRQWIPTQEELDTPGHLLSRTAIRRIMLHLIREDPLTHDGAVRISATAFEAYVRLRTGERTVSPRQAKELLRELKRRAATLVRRCAGGGEFRITAEGLL
ncbi:hypothetical protein GCM10009544_03740 [Streptomyces stramineus]|uniref:Uncharacterized protein n=1 Tax=Streptomyces stramineus TaxID=173861 RepID=A0ABN0ZDG9_9ACTN